MLESIAISKKTMSNVVFTGVVDRLYYGVQVGKSSNEVLSEEPAIPKMFTAMFRIGEETGELGEMVDKLADFYEDEVTAAVKSINISARASNDCDCGRCRSANVSRNVFTYVQYDEHCWIIINA